jgi:hypothetical protein
VLGAAGIHPGPDVILKCLEFGNLIGEPTVVLMRRSSLKRGFNPDYHMLLDLEMWLHLLEDGDLVYCKEPLYAFRQHPDQQSQAKGGRTGPEELLMLVAKYYGKPWLRAPQLDKMLFTQIYNLRRKGGKGPEGDKLAASKLKLLGKRKYAWFWIRHKITRPFSNLKRACLKRARRLRNPLYLMAAGYANCRVKTPPVS